VRETQNVQGGHFDRFVQHATPWLDQYGYSAIFLLLFVENFGVPVPGVTLFLAAVFLASKGSLNLAIVLGTAWLASVLGGTVGFAIGRTGGRPLLAKYGPYIGLTANRHLHTEQFFARYGGIVIVLARFFDGLRQMYALIAGCVDVSWRHFMVFNLLGATLWVGVWSAIVFWFGRHTGRIFALFRENEVVLMLGIAVVAATAAMILHRRRRSGASVEQQAVVQPPGDSEPRLAKSPPA
jgi:membrane protein DedA with SNARE-associated domain